MERLLLCRAPMNEALVGVVALAGCWSSIDNEVGMGVDSAAVVAKPSSPDSLATIDLTVDFGAGPRCDDHLIALDHALVTTPSASGDGVSIELALAPFDPFWIHADQLVYVVLANAGTTSAELAPYCGQTMELTVFAKLLDTTDSYPPWVGRDVAIACP